ncbi:MAG TPA: DUF881 domain-containing protein [Mycobacteriales bacterium]|nr:DUF881 domain-containing protein [Mycobacteriales bacterium]
MSRPPADAPPRRLDGSMSLLVDVMTNTLDEGYAERARRREAPPVPGAPPARPRGAGRVAGAVVLVLLGTLTGTAVAAVRDRAAAGAGLRAQLAGEVQERSRESDALAEEVAALRAAVAQERDRALADDATGSRLAELVRALELAAGTSAVTGPGLVVELDDAPADPALDPAPGARGGTPLDRRVLDRDLQGVVNGLWAAGAEAVAVNGVRLSSRAAIRSAGEAVLVDFRPISPPYTVEAVGRPADLEVGFVDGPAGRYLQALSQINGLTWSARRAEDLRLPAATEPELRAARPVEEPS